MDNDSFEAAPKSIKEELEITTAASARKKVQRNNAHAQILEEREEESHNVGDQMLPDDKIQQEHVPLDSSALGRAQCQQ